MQESQPLCRDLLGKKMTPVALPQQIGAVQALPQKIKQTSESEESCRR
jgi:hypothetical protein